MMSYGEFNKIDISRMTKNNFFLYFKITLNAHHTSCFYALWLHLFIV